MAAYAGAPPNHLTHTTPLDVRCASWTNVQYTYLQLDYCILVLAYDTLRAHGRNKTKSNQIFQAKYFQGILIASALFDLYREALVV